LRQFPPDLIQASCPLVIVTGAQERDNLPGDLIVKRIGEALSA
jgi:hypothetical protein